MTELTRLQTKLPLTLEVTLTPTQQVALFQLPLLRTHSEGDFLLAVQQSYHYAKDKYTSLHEKAVVSCPPAVMH